MKSKFIPLADYLARKNENRIVLSFDEIETILAFELCYSAKNYTAYWHESETHILPKICLMYGYEVESVDLDSKLVTFVRH